MDHIDLKIIEVSRRYDITRAAGFLYWLESAGDIMPCSTGEDYSNMKTPSDIGLVVMGEIAEISTTRRTRTNSVRANGFGYAAID